MTSGFPEVARHRAGIHDGHADAVGLDFDRQRLGEAHSRELGRGVHRFERRADATGDRPDRDDVTSPAGDHAGQHVPDGVHRPEHVDLDEPLHLVRFDVGERPVRADAGVGDEHVDRPELGFERCDRSGERRGVGDVSGGGRASMT